MEDEEKPLVHTQNVRSQYFHDFKIYFFFVYCTNYGQIIDKMLNFRKMAI